MFPPEDFGWSILTAVRDAVTLYYDSNPVENPLPSRRAVVPYPPAWDCEQMTVSLAGTFNHDGSMQASVLLEQTTAAAGFTLRAFIIEVSLIRCVSTMDDNGDPPTVERMEADARAIALDEQILRNAVAEAVADGLLPGCNRLAVETWTAAPASGGFAGGVLRFRVSA